MNSVCRIEPYKKKKKGRRILKKKRWIVLISAALIIVFINLYLNLNVNPIVQKVSEEKVRGNLQTIANTVTEDVIGIRYSYKDFVEITRNDEGEIVLFQVNTMLVNTISRQISLKSQDNLNDMSKAGVDVPIGAFSGIAIFAGVGRNVNVTVMPIGSVTIYSDSEFYSAGINQTIHKINLKIESKMKLVLPGIDSVVTNSVSVMICESIILGKIPDIALLGGYFDNKIT